MRVVLVGGTWSHRSGAGAWDRPGSPFVRALEKRGHQLSGDGRHWWW